VSTAQICITPLRLLWNATRLLSENQLGVSSRTFVVCGRISRSPPVRRSMIHSVDFPAAVDEFA